MKTVCKRHTRRSHPPISTSKRFSSSRPHEGAGQGEKQESQTQAGLNADSVNYADFFNTAPVGCLVLSLAGVILQVNTAAAGLFHRKREELKDKPFSGFLPADQVCVFINHLRRCRHAREQVVTELVVQTSNDSRVPIKLVSTVGTNVAGVSQCSTVLLDLTELKTAAATLHEETRALETFNHMGTLLTGQLDVTQLMASIANAGKQVTGATFGAFFYKRDEANEEVSVYITPGATRETFEHLPQPRHSPGIPPMEVEREAIRIDDLLHDERTPNPPASLTVRSYLAVPVVSRTDEVLGGLLFAHTLPGAFTERAQHLLAGIAAEAGIALDNARLYRAVSQSETHFRQLADAMPQIVWTATADGRMNYFNRRWYEYTGLPEGDLTDDGWLPFLHQDECLHCAAIWKKSLASREPFEAECRLQDRRTGNYRWHLIRAVPNRDEKGHVSGWFGTCTDIEDQKHVEAEIRDLNVALERRVAERTAQLQASNKELEAFSYSVSHDLRAPLRSIDAFSQLVREEYQDKLDDDGKEYLNIVTKASRQMGRLIDDLLHLSRVTRSEMRREPVDLTKLTQGILANLRQVEPKREMKIMVAPDLNTHGDGQLLRVALENLLNNAWKFTSRKPEARIEVGAEMQDGERVFFVRDNGAGFDMAYSNKLFGAFQRLHSTDEFPGHGIGLATVQRIINRHGGRIWVKAAVDQGATFYFTLPE